MARVGMMKNTANTHVVGHAGRILALMEGARPTELGPDLETVGEHDFGGALHGADDRAPQDRPDHRRHGVLRLLARSRPTCASTRPTPRERSRGPPTSTCPDR